MGKKSLKQRIFTAAVAVILPALLLSLITAALFLGIFTSSALKTTEESTASMLDIIRSAFFQNENEEYGYMLQLGLKDVDSDIAPDEALETIADAFYKNSDTADFIFFRIADGVITDALSGNPEASLTVEAFKEQLDRTVNADPEGYGLYCDGVQCEDLQSFLSSGSAKMYKTDADDTALIVTEEYTDGSYYGVYRENAASSVKIQALRALYYDFQRRSRSDIIALRTRLILIISAIWLVTALLLIFILKKITARIAEPVENERTELEFALRRAEDEKAAAQELDRLKTEFIGNISHELKTPLTVMSCYAQDSSDLLKSGGDVNAVERNMKVITAEAERLALMVSQLLDISRIDEGKMNMVKAETEPTQLIQDTLNTYYPLFTQCGNSITFNRSGLLEPILCDPDKIRQVLINLLTNASRHTRDGVIGVSVKEDGAFARFTVTDNGDGISPEKLPHIFERYVCDSTEVRNTGTGLGLYICKYIIDAHGGEITAESRVGEGTAVSFTVPFSKSVF